MNRFLRVWLMCLIGLCLCAGAQAIGKSGFEIEPPVPEGYDMPYTITVYLPNQMVVVYDAKTLKPVRSMICSSGNGSLTPKGTFIMPRTYTSGWDKWGNVYVRYPTRIKGKIYFHSILYSKSDKSLNMESWNKLGRKASHGCIRMTPLDAQWINYNCKKGTRVRIVDERGEGLAALHDQIRAQLNKNGHASVQPTLKPTPTPLPPNLQPSQTKAQAVKSLQTKLQSRGFYAGKLDGVFDSETAAAWNAYQKARGWAEDSIATTQEQIELANDQDTVAFNVNLSGGFEGVIVKKVEERLKQLGYFSGTPGLKYDSATIQAVKRYQQAALISPANGKLPSSQQPQLFGAAAPTPTPKPDLQLGSQGSQVKSLQKRLFSLGFYAGSATGKYQAATMGAVSAYQQAAGIAQTGTASSALQAQIMNEDKYVGTARKLTLKAQGVVVRVLEEKLQALGLFGGTPDGSYDKLTAQAVKAYQQQKGLSPTGVATGSLQQMIFEETP